MSGADHPLIRMLAGFEARVLGLATALAQTVRAGDADFDGATQAEACDRRALAIKVAAARRLWFSTPVPLDAFLHPGNRIAILAPQALRSVLAARALIRCQDSIRRCIDREQRRALALAVGEEALKQLQDQPVASALSEPLPLPDDLSPDALARHGWQMLSGDGACRNETLGNIVVLGLAFIVGGEAWQRMRFADCGHPRGQEHAGRSTDTTDIDVDRIRVDATLPQGPTDTSRFFSIAGDLFPEFQWLFG
ncbi:type III secretion protein HrpB4 [Trinickia acidisoli]|uniref:type III secretion protein HrpB4 n=1 Tax=Trinickia acidisoli TaxID=2767482 RepID=UPI001A8C782A|nr:type III secretion protein HrpB4 [Trinickia acidisoli]